MKIPVIFALFGLIFASMLVVKPVRADCVSECLDKGNTVTECNAACGVYVPPDGGAGLGSITNPLPSSSSAPGGGLIILLNNVLRLIFVGAGIYAFIRVIVAGLGFISAGGDVKKITTAWNSIWQSLLGLIIIIGSFAIAGLIGQVLFGDWTAILNPKIYGPN
jgi:hypothetical protein